MSTSLRFDCFEVDLAAGQLFKCGDVRPMPIKSYAFFDPLRSDPRFHDLLRKIKLA